MPSLVEGLGNSPRKKDNNPPMYTEADIYAEMTDSSRSTAFNQIKYPTEAVSQPGFENYFKQAFDTIEEMDAMGVTLG